MSIIAVIPARYASTRLPGKPLLPLCGKPMIWWAYQEAKKSGVFSEVLIAHDDERIAAACASLGMNALLTSKDADTPTERLYEVSRIKKADYYMAVMGDEPLVDHRCFDLLVPPASAPLRYVGALTNLLENPADVIDFSNQKVVANSMRQVLMISRSPIPYPKGTLDIRYEKITGVQIFSGEALAFYHAAPKSALETAEENDLMRFVENGIAVTVVMSPYPTVSVDTPKDAVLVEEKLRKMGGKG